MQRYSIVLEYIGTNYKGSQKQVSKENSNIHVVKTIQGELEDAISTLTKTRIRTIFSGRTDTGVHALGQVVHFDVEQDLDTGRFINSLNGILPNDISVRDLKKVPDTFHAQKSAIARYYRYTIVNRNQRSAWDRNCLFVRYPLNIERINEALKYLVGEHDFTSFKKVKTENPAKICKMYKCEAVRSGIYNACGLDGISTKFDDNYIFIDLIANRFLYSMVRTIVGTLLYIEKNNLDPNVMKEILELRDKTKAGSTVSADGLTLIKVIYNNINGERK